MVPHCTRNPSLLKRFKAPKVLVHWVGSQSLEHSQLFNKSAEEWFLPEGSWYSRLDMGRKFYIDDHNILGNVGDSMQHATNESIKCKMHSSFRLRTFPLYQQTLGTLKRSATKSLSKIHYHTQESSHSQCPRIFWSIEASPFGTNGIFGQMLTL